jgi:RimJ/RimL family protein N-acetyltransferase
MQYKVLAQQEFVHGAYKIVPIRYEDRLAIMQWRNEQIYHLRQQKPLTHEDQEHYFSQIVSRLFEQEQPNQILFSFLENDQCIGYGGLVHINWYDKHAEISFIMDTVLEQEAFSKHWLIYLSLIEKVAFEELKLHKIFTYAFDVRPHLYPVLEAAGFKKEAVLKDHCFFNNQFKNVIIHAKYKGMLVLRRAVFADVEATFGWASDAIVRKYALSQNKIDYESHKAWFASKISDQAVVYYVAEIENELIGSIRFDEVGNEIVISYLIDPKHHGKGLGKKILEEGIIQFEKEAYAKPIVGIVKIENAASLKIFRDLHFTEEKIDENTVKFTHK